MNASEMHPSTKGIFRFGLRSIWFVAQFLKEKLSSALDQKSEFILENGKKTSTWFRGGTVNHL